MLGQQDRSTWPASTSSRRWPGPIRRRSTSSPTAERAALDSLEYAAEWDSGYSSEHATRPQTIGYGLVDSPAFAVRVDRGEVLVLDGP